MDKGPEADVNSNKCVRVTKLGKKGTWAVQINTNSGWWTYWEWGLGAKRGANSKKRDDMTVGEGNKGEGNVWIRNKKMYRSGAD